jgi:hypothetical protein
MLPDRPHQVAGLVIQEAGHETLLYQAQTAAGEPAQPDDRAISATNGGAAPGGAVHALNPTARLIWDLCDGNHTLADIEAALRDAFEVPAGTDLTTDILRTLEVFQRKGLLRPASAAGHCWCHNHARGIAARGRDPPRVIAAPLPCHTWFIIRRSRHPPAPAAQPSSAAPVGALPGALSLGPIGGRLRRTARPPVSRVRAAARARQRQPRR